MNKKTRYLLQHYAIAKKHSNLLRVSGANYYLYVLKRSMNQKVTIKKDLADLFQVS